MKNDIETVNKRSQIVLGKTFFFALIKPHRPKQKLRKITLSLHSKQNRPRRACRRLVNLQAALAALP
jgi:hypothetical protein